MAKMVGGSICSNDLTWINSQKWTFEISITILKSNTCDLQAMGLGWL
jgi:hypothetical protein